MLVALSLALSVAPGRAEPSSQSPPPGRRSIELTAAADEAGIDFVHLYGGPEKSYIMEMAGSGAAWIDYDVDGRMDLLMVNALADVTGDPAGAAAAYRKGGGRVAPAEAGHRFFRNRGDEFDEVSAEAAVRDVVWGNGAAVADVDNDGFPDLYVTSIGSNTLYRNNGDGTFSAWSSGTDDPGWGTSAVFTDWDLDGNLDLYVVNYVDVDAERIPPLAEGACSYRGVPVHCGPEGLAGEVDAFYRNRGNGTFEPWPDTAVDADATFGLAALATDCDGDGRADIYVATDSTMNLLYRHSPEGEVDDWSLFSGAGYSGDGREQAGMGVSAADYDADGDFDLVVTNFQHDYNTVYTNVGGCLFDDDTARLGLLVDSLPYMGWGTHFLDVDGDADADLFVANGHVYPQMEAAGLEAWGQRNLLFINDLDAAGAGGFRLVTEGGGTGLMVEASSRGTAVADYDNDYDLDILVTNLNGAPTLLRNDGVARPGAPAPPALRLSLVGRAANRTAYGARVSVRSGSRSQVVELRGSDGYLGSNDPRLLFYLPAGRADSVRVDWPGGGTFELQDVAPGWLVVDQQHGVVAERRP